MVLRRVTKMRVMNQSALRVRAKISSHFRRPDLGWIGSIGGFKTGGIASYFEDFESSDRAKMA